MTARDTNASPTTSFATLRRAMVDRPEQLWPYSQLLRQHYGAFPIDRLFAITRWFRATGGSSELTDQLTGVFRRLEWGRLARRERLGGEAPVHTIKIRGKPIRFVVDDPATARFIKVNLIGSWPYEAGVLRYLINRLQPDDVLVDVGAHAGYFSLVAHTLDAVAFAIEPQRDLIRVIERNVAQNDADRIQVLNLAVSDHEGLVGFARLGGSPGVQMHGESLQATHPSPQNRHAEWVPAVRLDSLFLDDLVLPKVVKIDIEGMELRALAGAAGLIARNETAFVVELHPHLVADFGGDLRALAGIFGSPAWRVLDVSSDPPVPTTVADGIALTMSGDRADEGRVTLAFEPAAWDRM